MKDVVREYKIVITHNTEVGFHPISVEVDNENAWGFETHGKSLKVLLNKATAYILYEEEGGSHE